METSASMLQSLSDLSKYSMSAGGKPYRKSKGNLRKITSQIFGINRVPANKQGHKAPLRVAKSAKSSKKSISPMDSMLASFQSISIVKRPTVVKKTAKKTKSAPRQRPVKMQEDQSVDDMLASLLSKASTSISQKSRTIANKNIKKSKANVEKTAREAARRASASRSSSRVSKKPDTFKPNAKNTKKKSPKKGLSAIAE